MGSRYRWSVRALLLLLLVGLARATWSSGPYRYTSTGTTEHRRNWCPHSVTKTVTCQVQNGTTLQRVYQTCRWPQGCTGGSYRTVVRPSYKVVYRTITALEWKCCPGYSGTHCEEGPASSNLVAQEAVRKQATFRKPVVVKPPENLSSKNQSPSIINSNKKSLYNPFTSLTSTKHHPPAASTNKHHRTPVFTNKQTTNSSIHQQTPVFSNKY
uniref:EMI domain-containing protein n=1 Tax=Astyanax mexicanus TaxID=7994 RepID=A0A8B9HZQ6_ASTMX